MPHPRRPRRALQLALALLTSAAAHAAVRPDPQGPWQLVMQRPDEHIDIYTRAMDGTNIKEFRAETVVDSSLSALVAATSDFPHLVDWMPHVARVTAVQTLSPSHVKAYVVIHSPWPLHDRDTFIDARVSQDPQTGVVTVSSHSIAGGKGLQSGCVRMPEMDTDWTFIPLGAHRVKVILRGFGLPGGIVPDWAANLVITELPYGSLKHLPAEIRLPAYRQAHFSDIVEPSH